jgi:hypothetical protein
LIFSRALGIEQPFGTLEELAGTVAYLASECYGLVTASIFSTRWWYQGFCCNLWAWTQGGRDITLAQTSSRLEFELLTDECDGLRERTGTDARRAFNNARLAADILRKVEDRGLASRRDRITSNFMIVA